MMGWQWHQLDHMQNTSLETGNDASTSALNFFTGQMLFLTPIQQYQSTESKFITRISKKKLWAKMTMDQSDQILQA